MSASSLMPKNVTNLEIVEEPSCDDYVELVNQQRLILLVFRPTARFQELRKLSGFQVRWDRI